MSTNFNTESSGQDKTKVDLDNVYWTESELPNGQKVYTIEQMEDTWYSGIEKFVTGSFGDRNYGETSLREIFEEHRGENIEIHTSPELVEVITGIQQQTMAGQGLDIEDVPDQGFYIEKDISFEDNTEDDNTNDEDVTLGKKIDTDTM